MKNKIYNYLTNNNITIEKDVFDYGFSFFQSYLIYLLFIIPISIFYNTIIEVFLFIILYIPIRKNIGGFHLTNQYHCIILSIIMTLLAPFMSNYIPINYYFAIFIIAINIILFVIFVPVDCKEKRLSNSEKKFYKRLSLIILLIYSFFLLLFYMTDMQVLFQLVCLIELISAISIFLSTLKQLSIHTYNE